MSAEQAVPETDADGETVEAPAGRGFWLFDAIRRRYYLLLWWVGDCLIGLGLSLRLQYPIRTILGHLFYGTLRLCGFRAVNELNQYARQQMEIRRRVEAHRAADAKASKGGKGKKSNTGGRLPLTNAERRLLLENDAAEDRANGDALRSGILDATGQPARPGLIVP